MVSLLASQEGQKWAAVATILWLASQEYLRWMQCPPIARRWMQGVGKLPVMAEELMSPQ